MNAIAKALSTTCIAFLAASAYAKSPDTNGARVGIWTQDYDAAVTLARTNNLPLLINFTGSDWCGWCKLMDKQVFSSDEWRKWAAKNIVLAFIDFPKDASLVPGKYVARNKKLAKTYDVQGYPTYVIADPADGTRIGTLGASRDATPDGFIEDLENLLFFSPGSRFAKDLAKLLSPDEARSLENLRSQQADAESAINALRSKFAAELSQFENARDNAPDNEAKGAAEIAFKSRINALDKEFQTLMEKSRATDEKLSALLKKARGKLDK